MELQKIEKIKINFEIILRLQLFINKDKLKFKFWFFECSLGLDK